MLQSLVGKLQATEQQAGMILCDLPFKLPFFSILPDSFALDFPDPSEPAVPSLAWAVEAGGWSWAGG